MPAGKITMVYNAKKGKMYSNKRTNKVFGKNKGANPNAPKTVFYSAGKEREEWKVHDTSGTEEVDDAGPTPAQPLANFTTGAKPDQRVGKNIVVKTFQMKAIVTADPDAITATGYTYFRLIIAIDKQANAYQTTLGTILKTGGLLVNAPLNMSNSERFSILYNKVIRLDHATGISKQINVYKKLNMPVEYNLEDASASGTIPVENNIVIATVSNEHNDCPTFIYNTRIRYTDA